MPTNTEHTPQPWGSVPRSQNEDLSLSICSGSGKACGMPQLLLSRALLIKKKVDMHAHR